MCVSAARNAAVIAFDEKGNIRILRQGSNNFTCIPDDPTNPANDPRLLLTLGQDCAHSPSV